MSDMFGTRQLTNNGRLTAKINSKLPKCIHILKREISREKGSSCGNLLSSRLKSRSKSTGYILKKATNLHVYIISLPIICLTVISLTISNVNNIHNEAATSGADNRLSLGIVFGAHGFESRSINSRDYYYTRTRSDPQHLRFSEEFKNKYTDEIKFKSRVNGTTYEYYKSSLPTIVSHDELVFETIDRMFRHRLSPFYLHHYDDENDKRRSSDPNKVSHEACARDLLYLVDKLPQKQQHQSPSSSTLKDHQQHDFLKQALNYQRIEQEQLTPELSAFFDSYARQEPGLLMGNIFWVGAYDQCVNRDIFELTSAQDYASNAPKADYLAGTSSVDSSGRDLKVVSFKGRYCVSSLKAPIWDQLIERKKINAKNYFKTEQQIRDYSSLFRLQIGICLPDSCDSTSLERHSDELKLLTTSMLDPRYSDYELIDLYCLPDETSLLREWSGSAFGFAVVVTIWLLLVFLATLADVFEFVDTKPQVSPDVKQTLPSRDPSGDLNDNDNNVKTTSKHDLHLKPRRSINRVQFLVCCLSLRTNYNKFMRISADEKTYNNEAPKNNGVVVVDKVLSANQAAKNQVEPISGNFEKQAPADTRKQQHVASAQKPHINIDLKFLNAFKGLIIFWIINGHIMLLMIQTAKNILYSDALLNGLMHFLIGATFGVDLFFTMTGFLTSYLIFNSGHAYKARASTWLYLSFHRYWRLAPMYLMAFWFSKSVAQLLGSGPLWDYGTSALTFRGLCTSESWWYPFTLTSNLHGLFEECMITSWYISCDMQFWLISPIFIHLLAKSPLSGWTVALATIFASSKLRYDAVLSDKSARYDELAKPRADIFMRVSHDLPALYTHPHYRVSAYLVGLLAGHYVYMIKSGQWRSKLSYDLWQQQQEVTQSLVEEQLDSDKEQLVDEATAAKLTYEGEEKNPNEQHNMKQKDKQLTSSAIKLKSSRQLRNTVANFGLFVFLIMSFASYIMSHSYPTSWLSYAKSFAAYAYAIDHLIMSIGASFIIISMCFGQWPSFVKLLSHPNWTRLSKINYALLLFQCEAIYYQIFRYEQVPVAGTRELINILFNLLTTLYPFAFIATLIFEFPLANLEKLLLG